MGMKKLLFKDIFRQVLLFIPGILWPFMNVASQGYFQQEVNYKI